MLNNVKDAPFNAKGDGVTNDGDAIQRAVTDAISKNKGGIFFPAGTYRVSKVGQSSIELDGVEDFMVTGEGPKSVVKQVDTTQATGAWSVFQLQNNCRRIVFKDLVIDGNRTGLTMPDEQSHGIAVNPGTEDLVVDRCILRECFGDGIKLLGAIDDKPIGNAKRLRIENCLFQKNKRSGLAIQRAVEQVIISNCIFDETLNDQSIDFEPTGLDGPNDLIIQGCLIKHTNGAAAVTLSGIGGKNPLLRCKFSNNLVLGGQIFCTDIQQLTFQNNTVFSANRTPLALHLSGDMVAITGNLLVNDSMEEGSVISLTEANQRQVTRALITNNLCVLRVGIGIHCRSSDDVAIEGNMIVATGACTKGIFLHSENSSMNNLSVRNNDILVKGAGTWTSGIHLRSAANNPIHHFSVIGNSVNSAKSGIVFENKGFTQIPMCSLNRIGDNVTSKLVGIENLPSASMVVSGAVSVGAGRFLTGLGDPNNKVVGNIGDLFQRLDGGSKSTLYVKEKENGTNTGWVAK